MVGRSERAEIYARNQMGDGSTPKKGKDGSRKGDVISKAMQQYQSCRKDAQRGGQRLWSKPESKKMNRVTHHKKKTAAQGIKDERLAGWLRKKFTFRRGKKNRSRIPKRKVTSRGRRG